MKMCLIIIFISAILLPSVSVADSKSEAWKTVAFLEGTWEGHGEGLSGASDVVLTCEYVLGGKFLRMQTRAIFAPQEKNPKGEEHEDFAVLSYDGSRETFVLRAFYIEGFVNTFILTATSEDGNQLTFETEAVENAPPGTKAKLVFTRTAEGELEESFYVAFPGQELGCFTTNKLTKK